MLYFKGDDKAKEILINGINNQKIREACLAVLCQCTNEQQHFEELEKMITQGQDLHYMVKAYFHKNPDKSQYVKKLLQLDEEIRTKKRLTADENEE